MCFRLSFFSGDVYVGGRVMLSEEKAPRDHSHLKEHLLFATSQPPQERENTFFCRFPGVSNTRSAEDHAHLFENIVLEI